MSHWGLRFFSGKLCFPHEPFSYSVLDWGRSVSASAYCESMNCRIRRIISIDIILILNHLRHSPYWWLFGFDNNISRKKYSRRDRPPPPIYCKYPTFFLHFFDTSHLSDISLTLTLTFSRKDKQATYNANCRQSTRCQYPEWMCPWLPFMIVILGKYIYQGQ